MKMLGLDCNDVNILGKISRQEAFEFLNEGEPVVCQVSPRDFYEIAKTSEMTQLLKLEEEKIYGKLEFFIQ